MKVTKLIREYVEKSVEEAYPLQNIPEFDLVNSRFQEACEIYPQKCEDFCRDLARSLKQEYDIPDDWTFEFRQGINLLNCSTYNSDLSLKNRAHLNEIREKRKKTTDEILLSLELGANREELNRMISSLTAEEDANDQNCKH